MLDAFVPRWAKRLRELFESSQTMPSGIPHHAFRGRLMLRRPGYRLKPHRDIEESGADGADLFRAFRRQPRVRHRPARRQR